MHLCHNKNPMIEGSLGDTMFCTLGCFNFWTFNSANLLKYGISLNFVSLNFHKEPLIFEVESLLAL